MDVEIHGTIPEVQLGSGKVPIRVPDAHVIFGQGIENDPESQRGYRFYEN
jgi:hypothetical protein